MGRELAMTVFVDGEMFEAGTSEAKLGDAAEQITNPHAWKADEDAGDATSVAGGGGEGTGAEGTGAEATSGEATGGEATGGEATGGEGEGQGEGTGATATANQARASKSTSSRRSS